MVTPRDIAFLACRILALCVLVLGMKDLILPLLFTVTEFWQGFHLEIAQPHLTVFCLLVASVLLYLVGLWVLWVNADWLSRKMSPADRDHDVWPRVRLADLQVAAFSTVGLVFFASGLQSLIRIFVSARMWQFMLHDSMVGEQFRASHLAYALAGMVIGMILMLGSRNLLRLIQRLRGLGGPTVDRTVRDDRGDTSHAEVALAHSDFHE